MRLRNLNIKKINLEDCSDEYTGQDILMKLGELYPYESGIYGYGNLWTKLERKIENIIIEELDAAGAVQVEFPKLQPKKIWEQSKRWHLYTQENDILFTVKNNLGEYGLAPTAEECATLFGANRLLSYKNLPAIYYQIGEKFRKEKRTRGYLFRPRTFVMMDAYSFDQDEEGMKASYQKMHQAYLRIFERLSLPVVTTVSDNGTMGGKISEEFQAITPLGEDVILYDEKRKIGINTEVLVFEDAHHYLEQLGISDLSQLKKVTTVELGNNFQLGTTYSQNMQLFYRDKEGQEKPYYMGCYGIGVGRIIATLIENNLCKEDGKIKGFSLPLTVAPYALQIIYSEKQKSLAEHLYEHFMQKQIGVLLDDREDDSFGSKIKDGYVLGTPYLAILGNQRQDGLIEIEETKTGQKMHLTIEEIEALLETHSM